jgi:DNA repair protein RadC
LLDSMETIRERLLSLGAQGLDDGDLLALLMDSRFVAHDAKAVSIAVERVGGLRGLAAARPDDLARNLGVSEESAAALFAALELGRRVDRPDPRAALGRAEDVARLARHHLKGLQRERVIVIVCDAANAVRQVVMVSEGSMDRSLFPVREILNAVLRLDGRAFALAHNHPNGDPAQSPADICATREVREAAKVTGLRFLGHVVVTDDSWREVS